MSFLLILSHCSGFSSDYLSLWGRGEDNKKSFPTHTITQWCILDRVQKQPVLTLIKTSLYFLLFSFSLKVSYYPSSVRHPSVSLKESIAFFFLRFPIVLILPLFFQFVSGVFISFSPSSLPFCIGLVRTWTTVTQHSNTDSLFSNRI